MARRTRGRFIRPAPRTKIWIGAGVGATAVPGSTKVLVSVLSAGALLLRPFTILRTRMVIIWASDQISATEAPVGDFGKIVVTDTAAGIGVTAVPNPSSIDGDPDADWFVHQPVQDDFRFTTGVGYFTAAGRQYVIDSKAMRKFEDGQSLVMMIENLGSTAIRVAVAGRFLVKAG